MRKLVAYMLISLLLFAGCTRSAGETPGNTPAPEALATPLPTPTPKPISVLCVIDSAEADVPDFFGGVQQAAENTGWDLTVKSSPQGFAQAANGGYDGIIALRTNAQTSLAPLGSAIEAGASVTILDLVAGDEPPAGASYAVLNDVDIMQTALETALQYPPNDTPVRMLALFLEEGSPADTVYQAGIDEGKIFNRARHYETNEEQSAEAFLEKQLDKYVEGMLDTIFVETVELAQKAIAVLNQEGRSDVEVFCPPDGSIANQIAMYQRWVFPVAMGVDLEQLGREQVGALSALMQGEAPTTGTFEPSVMDVAADYQGTLPENEPGGNEDAIAPAPADAMQPTEQPAATPTPTPQIVIPDEIIEPDGSGGT